MNFENLFDCVILAWALFSIKILPYFCRDTDHCCIPVETYHATSL